jgi:cytochrome P450
MTAGAETLVDLADPDTFVEGAPHEELAALRQTNPVYFQEMHNEPGFWALLKHADVVRAARDPALFSASEGGVVVENLPPAQLEMMRGMLLAMDPPVHGDYRQPMSERFKARIIAGMAPAIRRICQDIFAIATEKGELEFVHDVTSALPSRVIGELMGLPEADWPHVHRLAERNTSGQDVDYAGEEPNSASVEMAMYAMEFASSRRREPIRDDLTSYILGCDFNGRPMDDIAFATFFVQLVTAGNDTTKTMLSSGLLALLMHPEQLQDLRDDRGLVPGAVEEILRWANPLHYFRRTAMADTEVRGVRIATGDKVAMYYTSANRDEEVFDDGQRFDIRRLPNPHLSFGIGQHFCLGVHLARLEGRVFFDELLDSFSSIELVGAPVRIRSNLNNGLKVLPVRLRV